MEHEHTLDPEDLPGEHYSMERKKEVESGVELEERFDE
jgi:hypothetical protein